MLYAEQVPAFIKCAFYRETGDEQDIAQLVHAQHLGHMFLLNIYVI